MNKPERLSADNLYRRCPESELDFETTSDLGESELLVGQDRANDALRFGLEIDNDGYNLYALGPPGTGKKSVIREIVTGIAAQRSAAPDWCYVNNFRERHKPVALRLPGGMGIEFKQDMERLIEELQIVVPATFESDEYRSRIEEIEQEFQERQNEPLNQLNEEAKTQGVALIRTPSGFAFAPLGTNGEVIPPDKFNAMSDEDKEELQKRISGLQEKLKKILMQFPNLMKEAKEKFKTLNREMARTSISPLFESLKNSYKDLPEVL
jgi:hypothetical protein